MNSKLLSFHISLLCIIIYSPRMIFSTWNFSTVHLSNDTPIRRFAIWRNRVFLAVPSFTPRKTNVWANNSAASLLEAGWPEPRYNNQFAAATTGSRIQIFPKTPKFSSDECNRISSVTGLDIDARGRLWLLDSEMDIDCPAKIIVYDLRRNDREIARIDLEGIPKVTLRSLVADPIVGISGPRAYIGDPGDETIIIYSLFRRKWWKLRLEHGPDVPRVFSTEMAISRKSSLLYLTGTRSHDLFSVDLVRARFEDDAMQQRCTVKWLGTKMGRSSGMVCDLKGGLHYFLVTEHASVRWDARHDLKTSSHSIVLQNESVPCITDYRIDAQRNVWGLVNLENPYAETPNPNLTQRWNPMYRTVRVYKYNRFGP